MKSRRSSHVSTASPSKQLASFIGKFDPSVAKLIRACRAEMRKLLPTAIELVYDNYNFFVIGYSPTERASDAIFSIAAASNGVGLAFLQGASVPDPKHLLQGAGKKNRFLRLPTLAPLKSRDVRELLDAALTHAKTPLSSSGGGYMIIKSVSAKQRPRRKT
ncbi:MAG: DUF1801 domain-containing protein [Chthoniobacterales bacterium]|nr:DUF1801 domain-containing protein [Chthoniobacterales bacterium]